MKKCQQVILAIMMGVFLASCATITGTNTSFTPWRGDRIFKGNGGAVETVNGVEFWSHGAPEKPYRVIGVISQKRSDATMDKLIFGELNRKWITELVQKENGDGVVTLKSDLIGSSEGIVNASVLAVFRYERP